MFYRSLVRSIFFTALACIFGTVGLAQTADKRAVAPSVTRIDAAGLTKLTKPNGKPLLVNFWATWCGPCREEFPDLVRLDSVYRGKIDIVTVSLDDLADIKTQVPKFLVSMKAKMPAYLLSTPDDDQSAAIQMILKDWSGNLPLTIVFSPDGSIAYQHSQRLRYDTAAAEIDKLLLQK